MSNKYDRILKENLKMQISGKGLNLQKHTRQLQVLSMLRDLQPVTNKIIKDMSITFDIRKDIVFQQAEESTKTDIIINMLENSELTIAQIANFTNTTEDFVEKIKKTLVRKIK